LFTSATYRARSKSTEDSIISSVKKYSFIVRGGLEKFAGQRHFLHRTVNRTHAVSSRAALGSYDPVNFTTFEMDARPIFDGNAR
jgi:hypothetical protein